MLVIYNESDAPEVDVIHAVTQFIDERDWDKKYQRPGYLGKVTIGGVKVSVSRVDVGDVILSASLDSDTPSSIVHGPVAVIRAHNDSDVKPV